MTDPGRPNLRSRGRRRRRRARGWLRDSPREQIAYSVTLGFAILVLGLVAFSLNH